MSQTESDFHRDLFIFLNHFETYSFSTLPVSKPYWVQSGDESSIGQPGIRATWIGHATVLAEVDSVLVITDPVFSARASPVQWAGPKRYRPPACSVGEVNEKHTTP